MITPVRTKKDLKAALARIDEVIDAEHGTPEYDELEVLSYKRPLSLRMIRNLHTKLNIPADCLVVRETKKPIYGVKRKENGNDEK